MPDDSRDEYRPAQVEAKWRGLWDERGTNSLTRDELREAGSPYYNLMMFPYPSAEGLHVGNIYAFTGADIHGRFRRLTGEDVFEPIGFDAFGIHSENFALKVGVHPMDLIPRNVANFTEQLRRMGGMFDWSHTVDTTDPDYYRWTQWIFLKLFEAGLAERKEAPVNWCPSCKTVLANEQVVSGLCERCDTPVEQRRIAQWFFKITDYAQRLLENLDHIDWSEITKKAQRNWIGRSEGARIEFPVLVGDAAAEGALGDGGSAAPDDIPADLPRIEVFTTRPDTLFGATYAVLAPEHPLVEAVTTDDRRDEVEAYRKNAAAMDLVARQKVEKEKTGVFTGSYCLNPATGKRIPVWIADYVLAQYGTGAIMAVPAHDQRDFEFARAFDLPIRTVVVPAGELPDDADPEAFGSEDASDGGSGSGGADNRDERDAAFVEHTPDEVLVNSDRFSGMPADEGGRAIVEWLEERGLGEGRIQYRLHDWCISRQRYWGPPIPIVHCDDCGAVPVPEDELPVLLPRVEDIKPDDSGVSPLARDEDWYRTECPACGAEARRETDVSDTFLDSSWYFLRYPSTDRDDVPMDPDLTDRWLPVDCYIGGQEHAVLHLLYARFVTMALHDLGHLDFEEPFERFRAHGLITRNGSKMSKSRGNVIVPDEIMERYGADTVRTYLMFMGAFEEGGDWQDEGIQGPHGFLHRLWDTVVPVEELEDRDPDPGVEEKLHRTIEQLTEQLPELQYNTSIAAMMEYLNAVRAGGRTASRGEVEPLVVLVAPFAPHLAEELWSRLGHESSIFEGANWPTFDPEKTRTTTVEIAVQVNGKLRGTVEGTPGMAEAAAVALARSDENVSRFLSEGAVRKVIHVPDRLVNFVVE